MKKITVKDWILLIDLKQTVIILSNLESDAETCNCSYCRNFISNRSFLPDEMIELLNKFGIPPEKDIHTCHIVEEEKNLNLYQIDYYFTGRILWGPEKIDYIDTSGLFTFTIHDKLNYRQREYPFPALVLECYVKLPWVIEK